MNAETDVDRVLKGERLRTQVRLRDYTPAALVDRGIPDLPMYMNAAHIRENILSEAEARAQGMPVGENINYHALGKELFLKAVDAMDGPIEVFQWRKNPYNHYGPNDYLVITQVTDQGGNRVVVPIVINSTAKENHTFIDANEIKSIYGKNGLNEYLSRYTGNQALSRIKEKRSNFSEARVQYPRVGKNTSLNDPTVPQMEPGVNPHSMQEGRKYSRTLAPELAEEHGTIEPGEHPANDVLLPRKDGSGSPVRRTYRTAAESRHADERMQAEIEQVLRDGAASYQVSGDREAADYAGATLSREGFDGARGRWNAALESGKTNKNDIALGERLYVEAANRGDYQAAREILAQVAAEATIAGQKVQAIRLIKRMGPAGELLTLEQTVRKIQKEIEPQTRKLQKKNDGEINRLEQETHKAKEEAGQTADAQQKKAIEREIARMEKRMAELKGEITIPDEVVADIMSQKTQKVLDEAMTRAYAEIGKQVPSNWADKWNAWRYMAMLINPTTHIRLYSKPAARRYCKRSIGSKRIYRSFHRRKEQGIKNSPREGGCQVIMV